ncbi:MAG: methyl-accepting chemotaxis protein [Oscillospiraceae bacterium]|nr:methyl-accepting chemotaxis protein [Oscillospiraceae bacterium]
MKNMKISQRLTIGFGAVVLVVLILSVFSFVMLSNVENEYDYLVNYPKERFIEISEAETNYHRARRTLSHMGVFAGLPNAEANIREQKTYFDEFVDALNAHITMYSKLLNEDTKLESSLRSERNAAVEVIWGLLEEYKIAAESLTRANLEGRREDAVNIMNEAAPIVNGLLNEIEDAKNGAYNTSQTIASDTGKQAFFAKIIIVIISAVTVTVSLVLAVIITKSITASLEESVTKLSAVSGTVESSSRELSGASHSLADSSANQAASIEETSATMNETSSMIKQTKENTQQAARLLTESEKNTTESMNNVEELMSVMDKLNESSAQIEKIADTINSLASQTNILALNASVEAVRVGEAGRGFAVVAEEVRSLSIESAEAARNTADIIKENIALAMQGVENSKMVSESLHVVSDDMRKINVFMSEISTASEEQSRGVEQIALAVTQMEQATQSNAAIAEQSSAAADELLVTSGDLSQVADIICAMV